MSDTSVYPEGDGPSWLKEIQRHILGGGRRVFLLHQNIRDLVFDTKCKPKHYDGLLSVFDYLVQRLNDPKRTELTVTYRLSEGFKPVDRPTAAEKLKPATGASIKASTQQDAWRQITSKVARPRGPHDEENLSLDRIAHLMKVPFCRDVLPQNQPNNAGNRPPRYRIGLVVDYLNHIAPKGQARDQKAEMIVEAVQTWSTSTEFNENQHLVYMLVSNEAAAHGELTNQDSRLVSIEVRRPEAEAREAFLGWLAGFNEFAFLNEHLNRPAQGALALEMDAGKPLYTELADRLAGMAYSDLLDITKMLAHDRANAFTAEQRDGVTAIPRVDIWRNHCRKMIQDKSVEVIQRESAGLLEPIHSKFSLEDIAGYDYVKQYMQKRYLPKLRRRSADISGILFAGPPGTGKSMFAGALGHNTGINVVRLKNIRGMYVGQSEQNLERALDVALALSPVIIFVDEIDTMFGNRKRSGDLDGGVEQRLLGRLLNFMEDPNNLNKVLWVGATNRPDSLDDALLARFKEVVPFLLPNRSAIKNMLESTLPERAKVKLAGEINDEIIDRLLGRFSGRELEKLVRDAVWKQECAGPPADTSTLQAQFIGEAVLENSAGNDAAEYLMQSLLALNYCKSRSNALEEFAREVLMIDESPHDEIRSVLFGEHGINWARLPVAISAVRRAMQ